MRLFPLLVLILIGGGEALELKLPAPQLRGDLSLEEVLSHRRSVRSFRKEGLTLKEISQLLWAAQGITDPRGFRTAPSAGALYPLEVYLVVGKAEGLGSGVYHYLPKGHKLVKVKEGDVRSALCRAALGQPWVGEAPVVFCIAAEYERTTAKYGPRGIRYVHLEAGHAAQNLCLQAVSLGLGSVTVGAFGDQEVQRILGLPQRHRPLYLIPVGKRR
ncbi:MAG: nitroreductase [Deltaproteobacteria bacterium]|nr:MAG: nitroreductase [Deltaproteobacteria bacterium]